MERSLIAVVVVLCFVALAHSVPFNETCSSTTNATLACDSGLKCSAALKCLRTLGGSCTNIGDCFVALADNGQCTANVCVCADKYVTNYNRDTCKLKVAENNCSVSNTCAENSDCNATTSTCACKTGYSPNSGRCVKPAGQACATDPECDLLASCVSNKCTCKSPYVADTNNVCKTSGAAGIFGSILTMLAFFVTSRIL